MYKRVMHRYFMVSLAVSLIFVVFVREFNIYLTSVYSYALIAAVLFALFSIKKQGDTFVKEKYPDLYKEYVNNYSSNNRCYVPGASDMEKKTYRMPIGLSLAVNKFNAAANIGDDSAAIFYNDESVKLLKADGVLWIIYAVFSFALMIFCGAIIYNF